MATVDPIFIVGTERSGSNLLRLMLNSHPNICVPHPPHIVRYFAPIEHAYGDLSADQPFGRLVGDIAQLVRLHIYPWEFSPDERRLLMESPERSSLGVCAALYEQYRERQGKSRWACKSTFMIDHAQHILRVFPAAQLIFLVRDPRDVAASAKRSVFSTFHPYFTARLWRDQQNAGVRLLQTLPAERIKLVRYEDILAEPEQELRKLCGFLNEEYDPCLLRYFATPEARKSALLSESWSNTGRPVLTENANRYSSLLSVQEIRMVETIAHAPMIRLGYRPQSCPPDWRPPTRTHLLGYQLTDWFLRTRVEIRSIFHDQNVWRRYARDAYVLSLQLQHSRRTVTSC